MHSPRSIDLEFAPTGRPLSLAMNAVAHIEHQLEEHRYRLEPLVRVDGRLVDALACDTSMATSYAWRIHLAPLERRTWQRLAHTVLADLAHQGVSVRTKRAEAA